jgi:hypothetical protein
VLYVKAIIDNASGGDISTKNHLHNNMLVIFVIGPNPDRIPTRVIDAQNRSVICTQDEGVTRSIGQVEALCRCLVDVRPVI